MRWALFFSVDRVSGAHQLSEKLEWIERQAAENLKSHYTAADVIAKEATTTLTVLLAGMGGGLAYAAKGFPKGDEWDALSAGAAVFTAYLVLLNIALVVHCLQVREFPAPFNTPGNLNRADLTLEEIREGELVNVDARIHQAADRNDQTASALNRVRYAAVLSPVSFVMGALLVW